MSEAWTLSKDEQGIATLIFDLPGEKVNKFTLETMKELDQKLDQVGDARALVIRSGKKGTFIAGADLTLFEKILPHEKLIREVIEAGHQTFNRLACFPCPTIAVIDGVALGGGCELALACQYRIATDNPKVQIGLPETQLGIIPGWGGTQRLPRLVGLQQGLQMILTGKGLDGKKALKKGLVDILISEAFLDEELPKAIERILQGKVTRRKPHGLQVLLLEKNPLGRAFLFSQVRKMVMKKTKGHYPAPLKAIDVIEASYTKSLAEGLQIEKKAVYAAAKKEFSIAPNLIKVFFGTEKLKKQKTDQARTVRNVGVIGAGVMGSGIAWLASYRGHGVRMKDISWEVIGHGLKEIAKIYQELQKIKRIKPDQIKYYLHRVSYGIDDRGFNNQDLVIEAATENLELKKKIFAELEKHLPSTTILATNTSSLKLSDLESVMKHPERLVGMHFFNPVNRMPLVEVVRGAHTSDEAVDTAVKTCLEWKKYPLVVRDCAGFLVNRAFTSQANEMIHLLEEGVEPLRLEKLFKNFGWPMGPFELLDTVGNDVGAKVFQVLFEAYGERMTVSPLVPAMAEKGLLGKKVGKGFYIWNGKKKTFNPEALELIKKFQTGKENYTDDEILDRVHFCTINEAARCLEEGVVASATELDMGMILGTGFPPFRGGLLNYANSRGIREIVTTLRQLEKKDERFTPCELLVRMAREGKSFDV